MKKSNKPKSLRFVLNIYLIFLFIFFAIFLIVLQNIFFRIVYKSKVKKELRNAVVELSEYYLGDDPNSYSNAVNNFFINKDIYTVLFDTNHNYKPIPGIYRPDYNRIEIDNLLQNFDDLNEEILIEKFDNDKRMCAIVKVNGDGVESYIVAYTELMPIKTVFRSINYSAYFIIIIMTIFALCLSAIISKKIAFPIKNLENKAKLLTNNDPNLVFDVKGYAEVESLNNTLNQANEDICKSTNLQKSLISNVSHDLRTPLTLIKAYAEMIRDLNGDDPIKRNENLNVIIKEADRLTDLVNNALEISKLENNMKVNKTEFNLSDTIRESLKSFYVLKNEGYTFIENIENDVYVFCDKSMIKQALYNLISNAVNYTNEKVITINLTLNDDNALVEIIDRGEGISNENISQIWDKFYRDDKTHVRSVKGSGLGLSIVKMIFENNNLEYGVKSKIGEGSNFYFVIKGKIKSYNQMGDDNQKQTNEITEVK